MTNLDPTARELGSAHILSQYQDAGAGFDGIDQMLLPHLRENRHTRPRPEELTAAVDGLGFSDFGAVETFRPNFVIDGTVLLSYARLDNKAVGAALVDAVADPACQVIVSSLAYLHVLPELQQIKGGDQRVYRLLRHLEPDRQPGDRGAVSVPPVPFRHVEVIGRLPPARLSAHPGSLRLTGSGRTATSNRHQLNAGLRPRSLGRMTVLRRRNSP